MDKIQELENRIEQLEKTKDVNSFNLVIDRLIKKTSSVNDANVTKIIGDSGGTAFDFPDIWLDFEYKGNFYRVPAYNLTRFSI